MSSTPRRHPASHRPSLHRGLALLALAAGSATTALAQPTTFIDLGTLVQPTAPAYASELVSISELLDFGDGTAPGETISVRWVRYEILAPATGDQYVDIDSFVSDPAQPLAFALYDAAGNFIVADELAGSGSSGNGGLSFGAFAERTPFGNNPFLRGQNGDAPAGVYWLALLAGPLSSATLGPSNWALSTTESFVLGFGGDGTNFVDASIRTGNTTAVPAPANDDCANAITIAENVGNQPAWTGSNFGATEDGVSPCYPRPSLNFTAKDVWLRYIPTITGWVELNASISGPDSNSALLSLFGNGCGTSATRCTGGGNFDFGQGSRFAFQVQAGVPVLVSLAQRGGYWGGTMRLDIRPMPAPCDLQTPATAIPESELVCGDSSNNGCNIQPNVFDTIELGQTVRGTLFNTTSSSDFDYYELNLQEASVVTMSVRSQLSVEAALFEPEFVPGICFGATPILLRTPSFTSPCNVLTGVTILEPGLHKVAIVHRFRDGFDCASGYNNYWISLSGEPCDQPVVVTNPQAATTCLGGSITLTGAFTSGEPIQLYQWQAGVRVEGQPDTFLLWNDLGDGDLGINESFAQVSGVDTPTLTIADFDEAARGVIAYRLRATSCAGGSSLPAVVTINDTCGPTCDSIDFNADGLFPDDTDLVDFLSVLAGGACSTGTCNDIDFNNDELFPDDTDLIAFLRVLAGGDC
jgi:hypothetical protein